MCSCPSRYDDGGYSGGSTDRPDLQRLLADIRSRKIDVIVVYKVDRLTRSLADFAKLVGLFDAHGVSFVSVTQQFNTTIPTPPPPAPTPKQKLNQTLDQTFPNADSRDESEHDG